MPAIFKAAEDAAKKGPAYKKQWGGSATFVKGHLLKADTQNKGGGGVIPGGRGVELPTLKDGQWVAEGHGK